MADAIVTPRLIPADEPQGMAIASDAGLGLFERLAKDPNASVEKIERLMALWERGQAKVAETAFNAAMSAAQTAMKPISTDAENPQTRSRYASYARLDGVLRPIYTNHGFALSFDTGDPVSPDSIRLLCYVSHAAGHSRTYRCDMPADGKGAKGGDVMTKTHAAGSAMSYGMRYLLKMIFNVAVGEYDDDGNRASTQPVAKPELGAEDWLIDLEALAENGWKALSGAFNALKPEQRNRLTGTAKWDALKKKAQAVTS